MRAAPFLLLQQLGKEGGCAWHESRMAGSKAVNLKNDEFLYYL